MLEGPKGSPPNPQTEHSLSKRCLYTFYRTSIVHHTSNRICIKNNSVTESWRDREQQGGKGDYTCAPVPRQLIYFHLLNANMPFFACVQVTAVFASGRVW